MSDADYKDLYNMWQRKAMSSGFTRNEFRCHYRKYVNPENTCALTSALGAKLAYRSLVANKEMELNTVQKEMENMSWF